MKIKLPFQYLIKINRRYKPKKVILPIGYDCHPAYLLNSRTLRKHSLPFDWLLTTPYLALDYAYTNIKDNFKHFLDGLQKNQEGKVYAEKFPEAVFYHYDDLLTNSNLTFKLKERSNRFLKLFNNEVVCFLFVIPIVELNSDERLGLYKRSIIRFLKLLKTDDELLIYVRFENSLQENEVFYLKFIEEVRELHKLRIATLLLESQQYGLWGNERSYYDLLNALGVQQKQIFPRINFLKNK